jgi:D-alanyl-D-alanine carboxypeptidase/D-alanyl-D-alanine-endopeptidase (penicillin-binding protein 4)
MQRLGAYSGAYVTDLNTGQPLFAERPGTALLPASVQKLYTTSVALLQFGPHATLTTQVFGTGVRTRAGGWSGTLYLRGGGDPSFGSARFDHTAYGTRDTVEQLVARLQSKLRLRVVSGRIVGDESWFDSVRGTIASGFAFDPFLEGSLSALAFNRGVRTDGTAIRNPPLFAAGQFAAALRLLNVKLAPHTSTAAALTPPSARLLASVSSPSIAALIALTNTPSDNFFAEMLTKGLGARFGTRGTTAAGVAVVRSQLAKRFGLRPYFDDGSGLSRDDTTTPQQVVRLLSALAGNTYFRRSLAIAGETGTLREEMVGTPAQGKCRGKTGTLHDVASLAGYCQAANGHTLAFAVLANRLGDPGLGHRIEADMAVAMAKYNG